MADMVAKIVAVGAVDERSALGLLLSIRSRHRARYRVAIAAAESIECAPCGLLLVRYCRRLSLARSPTPRYIERTQRRGNG